MSSAASFILRIAAANSARSVRPFATAAEAYDEAAIVRRSLRGAGSLLQVEDVLSGNVLGQWRHDGAHWLLEDPGAGHRLPLEVSSDVP